MKYPKLRRDLEEANGKTEILELHLRNSEASYDRLLALYYDIKGETMKDTQKKTGKETNKVEVDKEADVDIPDFVSIIAYMADAGYRVDAIRNVQKHRDQQGNTILAYTEVSIRKQGDKV